MKNFQKLAIALMVGVMAIGFSAFTNSSPNANGKFAGTYRLKPGYTPQEWDGSVDQDLSHYQLAPNSYRCIESAKVCTYSIDEDGMVAQLAEGSFQ